ncbi:uncharacterized protein LOC135239538 [Anguilla rostrata]|uniref:uncharacterized protein LOC135239538 n=1 Tax=Anguilla rostrata TaxID=7938 RepID=UPI0030D4B37A
MPRLHPQPSTGLQGDVPSDRSAMRTSRVLLLCFWLTGACLARGAKGPAPYSQVGALTEGLLRLLSGAEENGRFVEREGGRANRELRGYARTLARLSRRAGRADRLRAGLRRELQAGEAWEEGLRRGAEALLGLMDRDAVERRLTRVREVVQAIEAPGAVRTVTLNVTLLQAEMEAQDKRLSDLSLEVMIQDGLVAQQDQRIAELQASETREELQGFS